MAKISQVNFEVIALTGIVKKIITKKQSTNCRPAIHSQAG